MIARFTQYLTIPQKYCYGFISPAIFSMLRKLKIIKNLKTTNANLTDQYAREIVIFPNKLKVSRSTYFFQTRTLTNTFFYHHYLTISKSSISGEELKYLLSPNIFNIKKSLRSSNLKEHMFYKHFYNLLVKNYLFDQYKF